MNIGERFLRHRAELVVRGLPAPWVLVFDIDSTLMDTSWRNGAILAEAATRFAELKGRPLPEVWDSWDILMPLRQAGWEDAELLRRVRDFWAARFFTDDYAALDQPYAGAAELLRSLKNHGFALVYLTGRHSPGMETGTRASFARHGLPAGPAETFLFKPEQAMPDKNFKIAACQRIAAMGTMVGSLDNEPGNVNLLSRAFPQALNLWMDTITSPEPEPLAAGAIKVSRGELGPLW